ncbi:RapH N-terminal domain-containing protein [Shouchella patagoniensis]|uniref:response regulator aspartate phosphatase n=1 Tax=Shouchella patagoniensis TaxID=228576 RepID=UPI000994EE2A|nr:RapH N-terminal domain-containing protein [Shouchella patagoniensis]
MNSTLSSEEVGAKIVEWYSCIMASSYEEATIIKDEVKQMINNMEKSDKILAYYSLVEYRHENMFHGNNRNSTLVAPSQFIESGSDHYLKFLYYCVSGQNEFNKERYRSAVKMFRKAERLLEYVKDDVEEAEFFMYTGFAFYRINQYLFSMSYLEQAETIFNRLNYDKKVLNCKQVLGAIYSELRQFSNAEIYLKEVVDESTYPLISGLALRALGLSKFAQSDYVTAVDYYSSVTSEWEIASCDCSRV